MASLFKDNINLKSLLAILILFLSIFCGIESKTGAQTIKTKMDMTKKRNTLEIVDLRCEYLENPLLIDAEKPRLSWILKSNERNQIQSAYQIIVSSSEDLLKKNIGDFWDSKKIVSDRSIQIEYEGEKLSSRMCCFWKVKVWDKDGSESEFSKPAFWRMGLLDKSDWKADWIGVKNNVSDTISPPVSYLRKEFSATKKIKNAFAYITARGLYEFHLNGKKIGNDIFSPGWTNYNKRIQYNVYDISKEIKSRNCIGIMLGDGWYSGFIGYLRKRAFYGNQTSLLLQIYIEYKDGTKEIIKSDKEWLGGYGPIESSDFLQGEIYNAKKEMTGWDELDYKGKEFSPVTIFEKPEAQIVPLLCEPVAITQFVKPIKITEPVKNVYVYDLGQNIVGFARIKVKSSPDTKIIIRYAEMLNPDGTIYTTNLRSAKSTDIYITKGNREEIYQPHFTFHGFRYIEVSGYPYRPELNDIIGCVTGSDLPCAGKFECSNAMVNRLQSNILWGQRGNFLSIPTDCPQRDERLGWMGDAQIFVRTSTYNMKVAPFFTKWIQDVIDAQAENGAFTDISPNPSGLVPEGGAPAWSDAGIIVPWTIFHTYADTRIIAKHFSVMEKFMSFIHKNNPDYIRKNSLYNNYGDWLSIEANTKKDLLATAFWAYDAFLMHQMANAINETQKSKIYLELFRKIKAAFIKEYISPEGKITGNTQTAYCLALFLGLYPEELKTRLVNYLIEDIKNKGWHLSTGFLGVRYISHVLTNYGHPEIAYKLLLNTTFPSWGYSINQGATTIWERWDGWTKEKGFQDPGMNSFNHYSLGSVGEWLYCTIAGIDLDPYIPGFKNIIIHPKPDNRLKFAKGEYESIHGKIKSYWKWQKDKFSLEVEIPVNTKCTIYIPTSDRKSITENGKPPDKGIRPLDYQDNIASYEIGSGKYKFETLLKGSE